MTGGSENRVIDGRFELLERLGSGGMGTVWRARDSVLHREVALKEVRPPDPVVTAALPRASDVRRERVLREARALASINHPHVVTIHHIVDVEPHPWIVMELLRGRTLQDRLSHGCLTPERAAGVGRQVLSALRAAHAVGIQHRDVKPANVMLRDDGDAVLTDFGIAELQGSTPLTATGDLIGSPEYIAPERIRGHNDDPASDLWSLGVLLYVCVEGVSPLHRDTTLATLAAVLDEPVPPPVRSGPLTPVLNALLVRDPAARPDASRLDLMLSRAESGGHPDRNATTVTSIALPAPVRLSAPRSPTRIGGPGQADRDRPTRGPGRGLGEPTERQTAVPTPSRVPLIVAAVAVVVALVAASALVLSLRDDSGTTGAKETGGPALSSPTASTSGAPAPSRKSSPSSLPSSSLSPTDAATPAAPPAKGGALSGSWVAQLASTEKSAGPGARDRQEAALRNKGIDHVEYLDSDGYASLRHGYWMFYVPGFRSGSEAVTWCRLHGLNTANACLGRYVSDDANDRQYQCVPEPGGGTTGRCTRG